MGVRIHPVKLGFDCCYLIREEGTIVIDGGTPGQIGTFLKSLGELSVKPEAIQLIVITHGHWDHIGSARDIQQATGAKISLHEKEKEWLEKGLKPMPPGVNFFGKILGSAITLFLPLVNVPAAAVDAAIGDEGLSLTEYGISGRVIHTPGHSSGSVSILLDTGDAFVGDMAMNEFPLSLGPSLPVFAEDIDRLKESWRMLLDGGAKTIYPAHGKPFPVDAIKEKLFRGK